MFFLIYKDLNINNIYISGINLFFIRGCDFVVFWRQEFLVIFVIGRVDWMIYFFYRDGRIDQRIVRIFVVYKVFYIFMYLLNIF